MRLYNVLDGNRVAFGIYDGGERAIPSSEHLFYFDHQDFTWELFQDSTGATTRLIQQENPATLRGRAKE
ncbi:MAG: hypothetical protein GF372_14580 [Candidatus Marinimicrobia bacterium]|nr:hypothetical protein [Candidatus Neomarinimicrobiota bacterium]